MAETLAPYADFFALFVDYPGYVDFFTLHDLVKEDHATVRFFTPFGDFATPAVPQTLTEFELYRKLSIEFVEARNHRIADLSHRTKYPHLVGLGLRPKAPLCSDGCPP